MHAFKAFLLATFLLACHATQTTTIQATSETIVKIEPYASRAEVGESFDVNITIINVQNLYGVDIKLYWNSSILRVAAVDVRLGVESHPNGVLHEPLIIAKNETNQGQYWLVGTSMTPAVPFNGTGNAVKITFNVLSLGSCRLSLETLLSDWPPPTRIPPISQLISHATIGGFFGPIHISAYPLTVLINENVNVTGFIVPAKENVNVTILQRQEGETEWHEITTVQTDMQGNYQLMWQPQVEGKYEIKATAFIGAVQDTSPTISVTVKAKEQLPWSYILLAGVIITAVVVATTATVVATIAIIYRKKEHKIKKIKSRIYFQSSLPHIRKRVCCFGY